MSANSPGQKAKLLNVIDTAFADDLQPNYDVELAYGISPKNQVLCGAVALFKLNEVDILANQWDKSTEEGFLELQSSLNSMTQVMYRDPEYFREDQGQWLDWSVSRALEIFDELGSNANICVKCSKLRIRQKVKRRKVLTGRSDPKKLFWTAWEIDKLLRGGYSYDPWTRTIRRGKINASIYRSRDLNR